MYSPRPSRPLMQLASLKVAAWLLSLTLGGAAAAAGEPGVDPERNSRPALTGRASRIDGLREQLKLDGSQDALFSCAFDATRQLREEIRTAARQRQQAAGLAQPVPDLRARAAAMDKEKAVLDAKRKVVREDWLSFYDALSAEQKHVAGEFLLAQISLVDEVGAGPLRYD